MTAPHLVPLVESGPFVFTSGQLAFGANGGIEGKDVTEQTARVLANLESVLAAAGLGRNDIVKTTVWIRKAADFGAFNQAYAAFFGAHRPARSTVVAELALPDALVEIEAIAARKVTEAARAA